MLLNVRYNYAALYCYYYAELSKVSVFSQLGMDMVTGHMTGLSGSGARFPAVDEQGLAAAPVMKLNTEQFRLSRPHILLGPRLG